MSIETDLKKANIRPITKLDVIQVVSISNNMTELFYKNYEKYNIDKMTIFERLSTLNMYFAIMPEGMSEASYFYKNSSIYFNNNIDKNNLEEFAIHECLHRIQEVTNEKNKLVRMGLYICSTFKNEGLALNEAAVQLMTSSILNITPEFEKYYGISFNAVSPSYYPLICQLLKQLSYLIGEDVLFESTLNSNDTFKNSVIDAITEEFFEYFQKLLDKLLDKEEDLVLLNNKLMYGEESIKKSEQYVEKVSELKAEIQSIFLEAQTLIFTSFFNKAFKSLTLLEEVEHFKSLLYNLKTYIGFADGYLDFSDYIVRKTAELEHRVNMIENGNLETAPVLVPETQNTFFAFIKKIKIFFKSVTSSDTRII